MNHLAPELATAVDLWDELDWPRPVAMLVSGSGLAFDFDFPSLGRRPMADFFPGGLSGIEGHPMEAELLEPMPGRPVVYWRGRIHSYQGHTAAETVFFVRLGALLGARTLLMTNAAGGIDPALRPGDLVAISDHLNLIGLNPLRGEPPAAWGPRFPDLTDAYDETLRGWLDHHASRLGVELAEGVYAAVAGPSYETPAEVAMLRTLGARLVGMSTVLEVIAARHLGVRCGCISLVTNQAAGIGGERLDHEEVLEAGREAATTLRRLLAAVLADEEVLGG